MEIQAIWRGRQARASQHLAEPADLIFGSIGSQSKLTPTLVLTGPNGESMTVDSERASVDIGRGTIGLPDFPKIHRQHVRVSLFDGIGKVQKLGKNPAYL